MDIFSNLHDYHIALQGLNYISQYSLRHLLLHYIVQEKNLLGIQLNSDSDKKKFSKLFKYLQSSGLERQKQRLDRQLNARILQRIYTDKTKSQVKDEVDYEAFDISAMENILRCIQLFPFCQRGNIKCKPPLPSKHLGKCCVDCDKKHTCKTCGKEFCDKECCLNNDFKCDHPCKCLSLRSECKENSVVCCATCRLCCFCNVTECINSRIRKAIIIMIKIRNLISHSTLEIPWEELKAGTFNSDELPSVGSWDELCRFVNPYYRFILKYLKNNNVIEQDDYEDYKYYIKKLHRFERQKMLPIFREHIIEIEREKIIQFSSTQQHFLLDFQVKVKGIIPKRMRGVYGEFSEVMCLGIKQAVIEGTETDTSSENVTVNSDRCQVKIRRWARKTEVSLLAIVHPKNTEKEEQLRSYYNEKSKTFVKSIEDHCTKAIAGKGINGDVYVEGFRLGSFHLELTVEKSTNGGWNDEEIKALSPTIKDALIKAIGEDIQVDVFLQDESSFLPTNPANVHAMDEASDVDVSVQEDSLPSIEEIDAVLPTSSPMFQTTIDNAVDADVPVVSVQDESSPSDAVSYLSFVFGIQYTGKETTGYIHTGLLSIRAKVLAYQKVLEVQLLSPASQSNESETAKTEAKISRLNNETEKLKKWYLPEDLYLDQNLIMLRERQKKLCERTRIHDGMEEPPRTTVVGRIIENCSVM